VFCHKGQQQQVFFCVCQVFFETAIICKVTLLSLIQNRPSGVCRNDQFGADQGGRGRKGVKEIPPPLTQFLSPRSNDFADYHCLSFKV